MNIGTIQPREITEEMRESYLDYAMSVIVARALPDVRDGLKPVHRRILYTMHEMGLTHNAKFTKCANIVGRTLGSYHPHGDNAVYDSLVRLAQDFSLRYPLIDGQGNFGCFTGDTKVQLADGRALSFIELIAEVNADKTLYTYTFNAQTQKIEIAKIRAPRLTRKNAELMKVTLDSGEEIRSTPNHKFMLRDGSYREARELKLGDSLMPLYTRLSQKEDDLNIVGYEMAHQPFLQSWVYTHHLTDEWNIAHNVYSRSAGKIRHHKDFNKRNNSPENIQRLQWEEHWRAHYEFISTRHRVDSEYRRKLAEGRSAYYANEEVKQKTGTRISEFNKKMWRDPFYCARQIEKVRKLWQNRKYRDFMASLASARLKKKWREEWFRKAVGAKKSAEMKQRWQDFTYRKAQEERMKEISHQIWSDPQHHGYISRLMKAGWKDEKYRERNTQVAREKWNDSEYRAKFPKEHFINAAKKLWENPAVRIFHSEKIKKQFRDPAFREKMVAGICRANRIRLASDPDCMKRLAARVAVKLHSRWQDESYKEQVMRSKIISYVVKLLNGNKEVTPEFYEQKRLGNNWVPKLEHALRYFPDFQTILQEAKYYNHKVVKIELLAEIEDVYDLTIDGTHNFALAAGIFVHNSIDGDSAAAYRYTEARMMRLAEELLRDIERDTVDFRDNYDSTRKEPVVLPSVVPNLLLNGTLGIAVGMATNIPPHNLNEVADAMIYLIDHPKAGSEDLMEFIQGPDFPTGGIIFDAKEIRAAYSGGKGAILNRGRAEIEEGPKGTEQIIITEIPYQVNKAELIEKIAELVQEKRLEGIRDIRDESDKDGLRIAIDLKQDAHPQKVLNNLYKHTDLEKTFHLNMLALVDGIQPQVLSVKSVLEEFRKHRETVVRRRTAFDLARTKERIHILEGLKKALDHIDRVIETIKKSADRDEAHANLMKKFDLSDLQANAILEMRLATLAGLERQKIENELKDKIALARQLEALLKDAKAILEVIKKELLEAKGKFGDDRKTKVVKSSPKEFSEEDLIPEEEVVIVVTRGGYIKRIKPESYRMQKRGGKGLMGIETKEEDVVEHLLTANTHDNLLFFTDSGKIYQVRAYEIPEGSRISKGKAIFNFLSLSQQERITSVFAVEKTDNKKQQAVAVHASYVVMVTAYGIIKKVDASDFENVRRSGLIAITLKDGDSLGWAKRTSGSDELILVTQKGQSVRFSEKDVRSMGRQAAGVRAIRLKRNDQVVGMDIIENSNLKSQSLKLLVIMENGYGKQTLVKQYKKQRRGGSGIKTAKITSKTGAAVGAEIIDEEKEELITISRKGQVIRTTLAAIPILGRATQGVRIMKMDEGDGVASITTL